jgi:hypothetical protein
VTLVEHGADVTDLIDYSIKRGANTAHPAARLEGLCIVNQQPCRSIVILKVTHIGDHL